MTYLRATPFLAALLTTYAVAFGGEPAATSPITLEDVVAPAENSPDEPLAESFSLQRGTEFLDASSLTWQKQRDCMTCHTNYLYLLARPGLGGDSAAHRTVRTYAEELVTRRWPADEPRWDAEVVMTAMVLAYNDRLTTGELHPTTRTALDRMWRVQREDGGVEWINCGWPPFESDDEFGATMMALAVSVAPESYADSAEAKAGIEKLKRYFTPNTLPTLHHRAMLLWADTQRPGWLTAEQRSKVLDEILTLQHEDGSWSLATLGNWQRDDGSPQDTTIGDGYATGLAIVLARESGIPADDSRLVRGIAWLKSHQRESGRWFTRSLHKDSKHYIAHAGSNLALMAISACEPSK
jgi:squalene-hopene/tetraprenyl-beta-curcumene cyclase